MKKTVALLLVILFAIAGSEIFAQIGAPILGGIDTLYMPRDSLAFTIDPDPNNNPFMNNTPRVGSMDDPGGPGSGGGFGDPPPDAIIPLDGGVGVLVVAGALLGLKRRRKTPSIIQQQ